MSKVSLNETGFLSAGRKDISMDIKVINETDTKAEFVSGFEKGLALPIGNSLRRILLSSISGCAINAVSVTSDSGPVLHEFQSVSGVKEDMAEIVLHLKKVVFKTDQNFEEPQLAVITVAGPKVVTAADIETGIGTEVINREEYICCQSIIYMVLYQ